MIPSKTMQAVCYVRGEKGLLKLLPEGEIHARSFDRMSHGMFSRNIKLRTQFITSRIEAHRLHFDQWINLCSGLDCRAFNLSALIDKKVIRIDKKASLELANDLFDRAGYHRPNSTEIEHDLIEENCEAFCQKLRDLNVEPAKPTFLLWEGATYYLPEVVVEKTLRTIASYFENLIILAEFIDKEGYFNLQGELYPQAISIMEYLKREGEPWIGFFQKDRLRDLLAELGFKTIEIRDRYDIEKELFQESIMEKGKMFFLEARKINTRKNEP